MLSKSEGQILRVAAVLHILFQIHLPNASEDDQKACDKPNKISDEALHAAIDFVETSIQHATYIAGKDTVTQRQNKIKTKSISCSCKGVFCYLL